MPKNRTLSIVLGVAFAWLVVATIVALEVWPRWPETGAGWIALVLFGPPIYVLTEIGSAWLWAKSGVDAIPAYARIGVGVVVGGAYLVLLLALQHAMGA
ncbi:hypothetical protein LF41_2858 [Lysobacter dokdonensis DS-58]|uniref:Transmembrane protein n=1 Tax=Lysobacter dokdonensis DS-58 TaxID=1300345 RepID=A0A0A2WKH5_9GAMM|nr:hypothetical protein [Lysobacter dokdonensis]KGQ19212.1 hypothetical protein LF41_2858 [Lysobacter dokdonensis DS-58]